MDYWHRGIRIGLEFGDRPSPWWHQGVGTRAVSSLICEPTQQQGVAMLRSSRTRFRSFVGALLLLAAPANVWAACNDSGVAL